MRLWTLPFRLLGILTLAALASGAWLFRQDILRLVRPQVARVTESLGGEGGSNANPGALARARDKIDSLHGWAADSVILTAGEMASLLADGLPRESQGRLDSIAVMLGDGQVTVSARLETTQIPREVLGPLAGALNPWERISAAGPVVSAKAGRAEWRVDALTLRGITLPAEASHQLVERALPGSHDGVVPVDLPAGIAGLRIRRDGVSLYRKEGA